MFTFQSIMFVSLGFLCALLLGFIVAPAFWARAVRLTTERLRASLPLTEQEISAERDRLRAENAIRVHQLTAKIEQARLSDARQKVEINRRDGTISQLQRQLREIETEREGSENARRVLEATITQRVPEVEARLMEARQLLAKRDAEMKALQSDTGKTFRALDDAMQLNAQQRAEIDRLKMSLAGHGARTQSLAGGVESETALRAELEKLRQRSRQQAAQIERLQSVARDPNSGAAAQREFDAVPIRKAPANDTGLEDAGDAKIGQDKDGRVANRLDEPVSAAERQVASSGETNAAMQAVKVKLDAQAATIEKLTAEIAAYESGAADKGRSLSLRDSRTALKARVAASEQVIASRDKSISDLRRALASANERLAQQASYYQNELRRLGARNGARAATSGSSRDDSGQDGREINGLEEPQDGAERSLEARLKAHQASDATPGAGGRPPESSEAAAEAGSDFDTRAEVAAVDAPKPSPRGKLMDRIAELAKR